MLFISLLAPSSPHDWTTDPTILAWIAVASLIIGVLGIVAGFAIGYWFYRKGKNWHRVIYEVISDTPIVSVREQTGRGKIKVTYETIGGHSEEINDARLLTLKIWNAGNGDVIIWNTRDKDKANMEEPIEFEFEGRKVVGLTHLETNPPGKVIKQENLDEYLNLLSPTPTCLGLPRCLLKQKQSILLGILLNGPSGSIKLKEGKLLNGEVVDVHDLRGHKSSRSLIFIIILLLMSVQMSIVLSKYFPSNSILSVIMIYTISFIVSIFLVIFLPIASFLFISYIISYYSKLREKS